MGTSGRASSSQSNVATPPPTESASATAPVAKPAAGDAVDEDEAETHYNMGVAYQRKGNIEAAAKAGAAAVVALGDCRNETYRMAPDSR